MKLYFPCFLILTAFVSSPDGLAQTQQQGGKPVLIRDEVDKREEKRKEPIHDPEQARKSVGIGDFYFRRDNLRAAAQRYREAVDFDVHWPEAYEKLMRVLRRQGELEEAGEVCRRFIAENPESKEKARFEALCAELVREEAVQSASTPEP